MRITFMGTAELSCASLEALARDEQFSVTAVVTQPDRPKGRELKLQPSPVKILAQKLSLPVLQPARARDEEFVTQLRALQPDLIIVAAYGQILPQNILDLPQYGCLNVHTSLLPKYRGAAPIQWAIANGETETGATIMKMDAGLDTGPIVAQRRTPILPGDDSASLHDRLAQLGAELLVQTVPGYVGRNLLPKPQPAEGVSYAPKIKKEDGRIDWNLPAQILWNRFRAFTPWPGAFAFLSKTVEGSAASMALPAKHQGSKEALLSTMIKIWKMEVVEKSGRAGTILSADKNGVVVACGQNAVRILELQREGGKRLTAEQFLTGFSLTPGLNAFTV